MGGEKGGSSLPKEKGEERKGEDGDPSWALKGAWD